MHEPTADDEDDLYSARTEAITVVDGMEIDIEVRQLRGGDEERCEKVLMDLKDRLGLVAQAFEDETPPSEITDRDPAKVPMMTVAWGRLFSEDEQVDG